MRFIFCSDPLAPRQPDGAFAMYNFYREQWLADRLDCRVVMLVRHPAGIVSSLKRIGAGWADNLPDIAAQPELIGRYLRKGGAFFIRRSLRGSALYTVVFMSYMAAIMAR